MNKAVLHTQPSASVLPFVGNSGLLKLSMLFCMAATLVGCGGGGGGGNNASSQSFDPWLPQLQTNVVGSNSTSDLSGIRVPDLSDCQSPNPSEPNVVPMCVDDGPVNPETGQSVNAGNRPFVTIRLCVPGSTTQCVNVNHMLIDTGSTGVRVSVPGLSSRIDLPAVTTRTGTPVAECMHFVSGWTWGSLNRADVYIGGMVARDMPIHMMESHSRNPTLGGNGGGAFPTVPPACRFANVDQNVGKISAIGANGILGVGVWPNDDLLEYDQYFVCNAGSCSVTNDLDASLRPSHPSVHLPSHPGGVVLRTAAVSSSGGRNVMGSLTFGITSLPVGANRLQLSSYGSFTTVINGQIYPYSYIDSGTVAYFFDSNSPRITPCTRAQGLYCPSAPLRITATHADSAGNQFSVNIDVANAETLLSNATDPTALNNIAGPTYDSATPFATQRFAWGFPFFIGRTVYTMLLGTPQGGTYGAVAYTTP